MNCKLATFREEAPRLPKGTTCRRLNPRSQCNLILHRNRLAGYWFDTPRPCGGRLGDYNGDNLLLQIAGHALPVEGSP